VQAREALREGLGVGVEDEVDLALPVERDLLVAVPGDRPEAHALEHPGHRQRIGRGVLDELEALRAHGVFPGGEFHAPLLALLLFCAHSDGQDEPGG
jgi:hypothetical protein